MSIIKMKMVGIVGRIKDLHTVSKDVVVSGLLHPESSMDCIDISDFTKNKMDEENSSALDKENLIVPYGDHKDYNDIRNSVNEVNSIYYKILGGEYLSEKNKEFQRKDLTYDYEDIQNDFNEIGNYANDKYNRLKELSNEKNNLERIVKALTFMQSIDIPIEEMLNLKNFKFQLFKINKENAMKLKSNYENIHSIIYDVCKEQDFDIMATFTPIEALDDFENILRPLNVELIQLSLEEAGRPSEIKERLLKEIEKIQVEIASEEKNLSGSLQMNVNDLVKVNNSLNLELITDELENHVSISKHLFYITGWIPENKYNGFLKNFDKYGNSVVVFEMDEKPKEKPPTEFINNNLVKPFQFIVNLYGTPDYKELDPTPFLGITYTLIYGSMFGDVGQGLILLLLGLFVMFKLKIKDFGKIVSYVGVSSMIFGVLYGSVFWNRTFN